jgi:transcription elongation factor Elf1
MDYHRWREKYCGAWKEDGTWKYPNDQPCPACTLEEVVLLRNHEATDPVRCQHCGRCYEHCLAAHWSRL